MQTKTTRAFRTISEASEELDLQPHVLRFWESKFPQISPIKRGGGRRFYRPDDIEFIRGIKTLLHDEKHPIKDVQKLIRIKGAGRITELGRTVDKASRERDISDTDLVPKRIKTVKPKPKPARKTPAKQAATAPETNAKAPVIHRPVAVAPAPASAPSASIQSAPIQNAPEPAGLSQADRANLEAALARLQALRGQWTDFIARAPQS